MLKKLKLVLESHKGLLFISALKAAIFGFLLFLAVGSWQFAILFLATAFYFYFNPLFNVRQFAASFFIILIASVLFVNFPINNYQLPIIIFFSLAFFLILGIKNLIFIWREPLYYLLNGLLLLTVFIGFFSLNGFDRPFLFLAKLLVAFSALFFIFKEFLSVAVGSQVSPESSFLGRQKRSLMAGGSAFLSLQFIWVISFLPFRFINAASLALIIALILEDFIVHHSSGTISRQIILRNATMFLVLTIIIFGASKWSP